MSSNRTIATLWGHFAAVLVLAGFLGCDPPPEPADLVLMGGNIVTVDQDQPKAEAVAMRGQWIVAVGSDRQIRRYKGPETEVVLLEGKLAVPGFIEGHGHFMGLGEALMTLDLLDVTSWEGVVEMVAEAVEQAAPGEWITGRGWHQDNWDPTPPGAIDGVPTHHALSQVSPDNPVLLRHASGHGSFANAKALELAGITRHTPDPDGGTIVRDERGEPTGYLRQAAQGIATAARSRTEPSLTPEQREARLLRKIELAGEESLRFGVTSFQDAGAPFSTIDRFRRLAEQGELPVRLYAMVRGESNRAMERRLGDYRMIGHGDHFLTVRCVKTLMDGALGTHGAWLLEPYEDLPTTTGLVQLPPDELERIAEIAIANGYQVANHAIGDRANRETLDVYERVFRANPDKEDLRWRIEHAQHLHPDDIDRFAELGVIASMQAVHATSDGSWVPNRVGHERAREGAYVWRSLLDSGAVVTNGTDVPVERINPMASFFASVTRQLPDGSSFFPEQRKTREEALYSYTMAGAYAAFEEDVKGSITPGKLADIVVLSRDIMTIPEEEILDTDVVYTILGGRVVYRGTASAQ